MSLRATLWHISAEHKIGVIFMEVVIKHYFATVPMTLCQEPVPIVLRDVVHRYLYISGVSGSVRSNVDS